jgi:K+-transporting ATPase ATPase C chain
MTNKLRLPLPLSFLLVMTVLTGIVYPLVITGLAQVLFQKKADGSLVVIDGGTRGSSLLAQRFDTALFFKARPSASDYAWVGAGASNLALTNPELASAVAGRRAAWKATFTGPAPADMLYASASGLDPDISLDAALGQLPSVAAARGFDAGARARLETLIRETSERATSLLGPPRLNVMILNVRLATDPLFAARK